MKRSLLFVMLVVIICCFTGCGATKDIPTPSLSPVGVERIETENIIVERIEVKPIEVKPIEVTSS